MFTMQFGKPASPVVEASRVSSDLIPASKSSQVQVDLLDLIDGRTLDRECFVRSIELSHPPVAVSAYGSVADWQASIDGRPKPRAILLNIGYRDVLDPSISRELSHLVGEAAPVPVVVLGGSDDLGQMIGAIDLGARGYIPASVGIDVVIEATRLASSGGIFLPARSILSLRNAVAARPESPGGIDERFTSRQAAVAHALRRGKANKIIAYELKMSESTVKIHIRNIMKKLNATNRTEAAFKLNALL